MKKYLYLLFLCTISISFAQIVTHTPSVEKIWAQLGTQIGKDVKIDIIESDLDKTVLEFQIPGHYFQEVVIDGSSYVKISAPGATALMEKGFPDVPKLRRNIIIADDALMELNIIEVEDTIVSVPSVASSKGHLPRSVNPDTIPYTFDDIYQQDTWYPENRVMLGEPFIVKDFRGLAIQLNPYQYNPVQQRMKICKKIVIEIAKTGSGGRNTKERDHEFATLHLGYSELYQDIFINYEILCLRYTPIEEPGRLLIIVHSDFTTAIQDFVDWKITKGIPTVVAEYPTDIGAGIDNIEDYIQDMYDSDDGLTYIIIIGDDEQVPTMEGDHAQHAPSDPMYAKLEGDDNYPDAFISRISATTVAEVLNQLTKILNYERFPDIGTAARWYEKGTGVASAEGTPTDYERCDDLRDELLNYGYSGIDQIYDPGATDDDVTDAINDGRGLVNYLGHGGSDNWVTTGFDNDDIDDLTNANDLPFIIDVACMNGNFTWVDGDCFAERWLKTGTVLSPRGAIGVFASSRNADWVPPCIMQEEAIALLVAEQTMILGGLCFAGIMKGLDEYPGNTGQKLMEQYNLFGDCTMELRTKTTETFTVVHPSNAPRVNNNFVVAVKKGFAMIPEARVTLTKDGEIVDSKLTGTAYPDKGIAKFSYDLSTGPMTICVTKPNHRPYVGACQLESYTGNLWVSLHGGATRPYDEWYDETFCFNAVVNFEYRLTLAWALVVEVAYNDFMWMDPYEHFPWWNINPTLRFYIPSGEFMPFISIGPGYYIPDNGDNRFGIKAGIGFDYMITERIIAEIGSDYHTIFAAEDTSLYQDRRTSFQHFHGGLVYRIR